MASGRNAVSGTIQRSNLDGTGMTTLIDDLVFPQPLSATADYLYWTDQDTRKIQRANLDGSGLTDIIITGLTKPVGLAVVTAPVPHPSGSLAPACWV